MGGSVAAGDPCTDDVLLAFLAGGSKKEWYDINKLKRGYK